MQVVLPIFSASWPMICLRSWYQKAHEFLRDILIYLHAYCMIVLKVVYGSVVCVGMFIACISMTSLCVACTDVAQKIPDLSCATCTLQYMRISQCCKGLDTHFFCSFNARRCTTWCKSCQTYSSCEGVHSAMQCQHRCLAESTSIYFAGFNS